MKVLSIPERELLGDNLASTAYTMSGSVSAGLHHRLGQDQMQRLLRPSPEDRAVWARNPLSLTLRPVIQCAPRVRSIMVAGPRGGAWRVAGAFQRTSEGS